MHSPWAGVLLALISAVLIDASVPPRLPLTNSENVRVVGAQEWDKLVAKNTEDTCWDTALNRFRELAAADCGASQEITKTLLALTLTKCHYAIRLRGFPSPTACPLEDAFKEIKRLKASSSAAGAPVPSVGDEKAVVSGDRAIESPGSVRTANESRVCLVVKMIAQKCLGGLSESAFESTLWQEKTEETVNRLVFISADVVEKLNVATRQNALLVEQQRVALAHQKEILLGSENNTLELGHATLQSAFSAMKDEVQREQKKLVSVFDEIFSLIGRVMQLQQSVLGRLSDFETAVTYVVLVVSTFYITGSDSTRRARGSLYALWMVMAFGEFGLWRANGAFEALGIGPMDTPQLRDLVRRWRSLCIVMGALRWTLAWWNYQDPTTVIVGALEAGLQDLKEQITQSSAVITFPEDLSQELCAALRTHVDTSTASQMASAGDITAYMEGANAAFDLFRPPSDTNVSDDPDYIPSSCTTTEDSDTTSVVTEDLSSFLDEHLSTDVRELSDDDGYKDDGKVSVMHTPAAVGFPSLLAGSVKSVDAPKAAPLLDRRNPFRHARPLAYRAPRPGCLEDVKMMRLNPLLLFETPEQFFERVVDGSTRMERRLSHCNCSVSPQRSCFSFQRGTAERRAVSTIVLNRSTRMDPAIDVETTTAQRMMAPSRCGPSLLFTPLTTPTTVDTTGSLLKDNFVAPGVKFESAADDDEIPIPVTPKRQRKTRTAVTSLAEKVVSSNDVTPKRGRGRRVTKKDVDETIPKTRSGASTKQATTPDAATTGPRPTRTRTRKVSSPLQTETRSTVRRGRKAAV